MYDVSGGDSGDEHSQSVDWDKVKCAACNRATQRPDLQVLCSDCICVVINKSCVCFIMRVGVYRVCVEFSVYFHV